jgi:hypothetical protein
LEAGSLHHRLVPGPAGHPPARRGFGISQATAYRHKDERAEVLAPKAPTLHQALDTAVEQGFPARRKLEMIMSDMDRHGQRRSDSTLLHRTGALKPKIRT